MTRTLIVERAGATTLAMGEAGPPTREVAITYAAQPARDMGVALPLSRLHS